MYKYMSRIGGIEARRATSSAPSPEHMNVLESNHRFICSAIPGDGNGLCPVGVAVLNGNGGNPGLEAALFLNEFPLAGISSSLADPVDRCLACALSTHGVS